MILRRSNNNGTDVYEEISLEEAIKLNKKEIIFTDEEDKEAYEEAFKEQKKDRKDPLDQFVEGMENFGEKINKVVNDAFKGFSNNRYNEKTRKIKKILPFLGEEDLKEIVEAILAKDEKYEFLPLDILFPYLNEEDCDRLFMMALDDVDMKNKIDIQKLVPFVSEECMDKFVDLYVQGKYKNVNIDELYPFMNNKSIKKIFSYYLCKD
ncbi:MAG: hypothetical protein MR674_02265, partial [Erysipelotrichaceae bacterium]|nr:hypothetical protein [Erysipelotrichaceae bacterium]